MSKNKITFKDIFNGILFSSLLLFLGYYLSTNHRTHTSNPIISVRDYISNPYILIALAIAFIIIGAFCSVLARANMFGLHIHSFFKNNKQKDTKKED